MLFSYMVNFQKIEKKWQVRWEKGKIFEAKKDSKKNKFYILEMFPYPSGKGLHIGHAFNYTIGDIYARFKRMKNLNVLYPMGYDSFGLPAENAAIKVGEQPEEYTKKAIKNFVMQQKALGISYDWTKKIKTSDKDYYKWNQLFFLKLLKNNLVYKKNAAVNWCPKCETVLANEQVQNGKCWRHETTDVEIKHLKQWFIKTTEYADELLENLENLNWPDRIKLIQKNWIGKSHGVEIKFDVNGEDWEVFTTRPDTIYGVTFMVISAQHPRLMEIVTKEQKNDVENFLKKLKSVSEKELKSTEKEGIFTGNYAVHPLTKEKIPIYTGNFVVSDYGSGMVMGVPAHDQRDFEFAKKYKIPLKLVIQSKSKKLNEKYMNEAFTESGILINSEKFNGLKSENAIKEITKKLEIKKIGKKAVQYKLRDWLISRQRYWGTPIPIIYCDICGVVPVDEKNLPVELPKNIKFSKGNPLASNEKFVNVKCPRCNGKAKRETDTMDTFFDSSWYYFRYCDNKNSKKPFEKEKVNYWMPIDCYIGGKEHACTHLLYARFITKALRDMKLLNIDEPFSFLFNQGTLHASDGRKMSKSLGNVINPIDMIKKYSADTLRITLMSLASPDKDSKWNENGIDPNYKFLNKIYDYFENLKIGKTSEKIKSKINRTLKGVTEDIENFRYNLAIIKIRGLFESFEETMEKKDLEIFLEMLHPFCPHITEELWEKIGNKKLLSLQEWAIPDESKINMSLEYEDILISNIISDINSIIKLTNKKPEKIKIFIAEEWKYEFMKELKKNTDKGEREFKTILKKVLSNKKLKKYGKEISKMIPKYLSDINKIPLVILKNEFEKIKNAKEKIKEEFSAEIQIIKEKESKESKSKQAMPGKPAILVR